MVVYGICHHNIVRTSMYCLEKSNQENYSITCQNTYYLPS